MAAGNPLGSGCFSDPGVHRVIAEASAYRRMELSTEVGAKADRKVLSVPALTRAIEPTEAEPSTARMD